MMTLLLDAKAISNCLEKFVISKQLKGVLNPNFRPFNFELRKN